MTGDKMVGWHHQLNGMSLSKLQEIVKDGVLPSMGLQRVRQNLATEQFVKKTFLSLIELTQCLGQKLIV